MFSLASAAVFLASLLAGTVAGDDGAEGTKVWAVVAYVNHGERTPFIGGLQTVLTPEGAQQMWRQGNAFRNRYLTGSSNGSRSDGAAPIQKISANVLDNTQVAVVSQSNDWVVGSAMAFMQGLYPPRTDAFVAAAGGEDLGRNLANGTSETNYPLGGYQYPMIRTLSPQESSFVASQGGLVCFNRRREIANNLNNSQSMQEAIKQHKSFYHGLFSSPPLQGLMPLDRAGYENALDIYELVDYMYNHNQTVYDRLEDAQNTLDTLQALAFTAERARISPPSGSSDEKLDTLYSVAGRTLATQLARLVLSATGSEGRAGSKMAFLFGSMRPLLSFLSVAGLLTSGNASSSRLSRLPEPGASIVLEVISSGPFNASTPLPETDALQVRFSYKPSADSNAAFERHPLFGSGSTMPYRAFIRQMRLEGVTPLQWCDVCGAGSVLRVGGRDEPAPADTARIMTSDVDRTPRRQEDDGDGISITGMPVKAREGV
ncbi:hypothetical protein HIM_08650 [Hirsutella minnesotensis 3608]|uniref:Acid phosphatase n=1 Tax=Hirsutella minnesotensis 3608 TaxID=1043627 RepID=A0A0F7ZMD7_9HYPO|nr:hypothetical protein HIM_08650 [Hirsutella minnesotensis 3608]